MEGVKITTEIVVSSLKYSQWDYLVNTFITDDPLPLSLPFCSCAAFAAVVVLLVVYLYNDR